MARQPPPPDERHATIRQALQAALLESEATARDLSKRVGIREHDVAGHLEHLDRSLRRSGERLVVEPARCLDCDFAFTRREKHRYTRPGRCPQCHGRRITLPRFRIGVARGR